MHLNLNNIEDVIFFDKKLHHLFPEFRHLFDQWAISKRVPGMASMGRRSVLELLNSLEARHIQKLEEYLGTIIVVDKLDHHIARHYEGEIHEAEKELCQFDGYQDFCLHRNGERLYISYWR